jgi:hypothetical protein
MKKKQDKFFGNCVLWKKNGEEKRRKKIVIDPSVEGIQRITGREKPDIALPVLKKKPKINNQ